MAKRLFLICSYIGFKEIIFDPYAKPFLSRNPGFQVECIADSSIYTELGQTDGLCTESILRRVGTYAHTACELGADCIMIACTSLNDATEVLRRRFRLPLFNMGEPAVDEALAAGKRITIVGTISSVVAPTKKVLSQGAQRKGLTVELDHVIVPGIFDLMREGNLEAHNAVLHQKLLELSAGTDVIYLPQISASRFDTSDIPVPVIKIGKSAFDYAESLMRSL